MKFRALHDRLIVEKKYANNRGRGGVHLPSSLTEKQADGKVLSAGPKCPYKPGETVVFSGSAGNVVEHDYREFIILRTAEVIGSR